MRGAEKLSGAFKATVIIVLDRAPTGFFFTCTYIMLEYMYAFNFHLDVAGHSRGIHVEKIPYPYQLNKAYIICYPGTRHWLVHVEIVG